MNAVSRLISSGCSRESRKPCASRRAANSLAATPESGSGLPGTVLDETLLVATGEGALRLTRIQAPGRAAMPAEAFLRGRKVPPGTRLG